jgi:hypothetical protein
MKRSIELKAYPQQTDFIEAQDGIIAFIAGVGAGKTHAGAIKSLKYCLENPGAWGIITAPQNKILDIATIPKYEMIFPPDLVKSFKHRPYPLMSLRNGCRLFFWSTELPDTIIGGEMAFAHMDEASLSPYRAFENIKKRLRQKTDGKKDYPYQIWITTTPRQLNWLYSEITSKTNPIRYIQATTMDNKFMENSADYIARLGLTGKIYEQEVLGKFVSLTGECLFNDETLSRCLNETIKPIDVRGNGYIYIWKDPVVGLKYVAGADCADEGGGGVNDLVILDPQTGMEMAEISADVSADKFADMVYNLCEVYKFPFLGVERNGAGNAVVQKLVDMKYPNLYRDEKGKYGWFTNANAVPPKVSRLTMLLEYEEAVRLRRTVVLSSDAVGEMSTFVRDKEGKYKHREGNRDDRLFARAIAWQMTKYKNYGEAYKFGSYFRTASSYANIKSLKERLKVYG